MAPHVEANSLSDITQLASAPPRYPRNPTDPKRASLTLYIARVPGSRDIILTTLKPQLKNVTAADVSSSLYYCHLNTEDDARFLEEDQPATVEETTGSTQKPLLRKPLPESARSSFELNGQMTSMSLIPESNLGVLKRKPVTSEVVAPVLPQPGQGKQNISRRSLGPRSLLSEPISKRASLPVTENQPLASTSQSEDPAAVLKVTSEAAISSQTKDVALGQSGLDKDCSNTFSITLIRRDPSSGAQWNIGNVSGHLISDESTRKTKPQAKKPYFDISIHLSTPGYNAFRHPIPTGHARDDTTGVSATSVNDNITDRTQPPSISNFGFDRQLQMEGSSFWSRRPMQHKRALSDLSENTTRGRSSSGSSYVGPTETGTSLNSHEFEFDSSDSQSKGYMFISPWGGRCKFSTAKNGRSLRLKHTLANNTASSTPLLQASAPVSELRFNLPSSAVFSSKEDTASKRSSFDSGRFTTSKFTNLREKLSPHKTQPSPPPRPHPTSYAALYPSDEEETPPLPPRSYHRTNSSEEEAPPPLPTRLHPFPYSTATPHEDDVDDDPRLDLSIGQERAGGGNRGKRAKLGKLIIHDEGFKMLDLVVAANIGVWWSVWESVSR